MAPSFWQIAIVLLLVVMLFGRGKISELMGDVARGIKSFKKGMQDTDVPWMHATELMEKFAFDDAVLTLVRDGDHRLSREEDLERLVRAVEALIAG